MSKLPIIQLLAIAATVAAVAGMPAMAEELAPAGTYAPAVQSSPATRSPGTMRESDFQNPSAAPDQPLQPVQAGDVTYITGGIGDDERAQLETAKPNYNLWVTSASGGGEYIGNTHIVIRNRRGDELLNTSAGPLFYARLPAGSYTVEANHEGQSQRQRVTVGDHKSSSVRLIWH